MQFRVEHCLFALVATLYVCAGCTNETSNGQYPSAESLVPREPTFSLPQTECEALIDRETKECGEAKSEVMCLDGAELYDATGCLHAWVEYIECRSEADIDCETGMTGCENARAYIACQSQFVQKTGCIAGGRCAEKRYLYNCLSGTPPFDNCEVVETPASSVSRYCCGL